ncbi:snare-dependent exocytosis protein-like protein [Calycina marina]|uniref:Snare-dependent exocytosis protein-like protein n=1 Tax=Calycina marina TaxID=1763456 RepID=A0A9P7YZI2_9HELO|nr:snare-dependent exocytosis protein-like protein [Calycina marina]
MAAYLRGKQAGIQHDLSAGILPGLFGPDDIARFGVNSQIGALAYDPVQSLLAIGTNESPYGSGQIYIFGRERVKNVFTLPRRASVKDLQFVADRLISFNSKNELTIWDLRSGGETKSYSPPGIVTCMVTDPMLDWAILGLQNGDAIMYDLDREKIAPLRLPNFWKERSPRSRLLSVVSMQLHPRDIGQLLIGYTEGAVLYSFKQNAPLQYFHYEVPVGAPGGSPDPLASQKVRSPRLNQVFWHPTGTFVGTAYDDESIVIWDPKEARIVMARTTTDTYVNKVGGQPNAAPGTLSLKVPFARINWCCKENPDDTGILIAGGVPTNASQKGLTFIDLGPTPVYATSSWPVLASHLEGKRQHLLPTPPGAEIADFCLIPRTSPHFAGAQDPIAVLVLLTSGELITMSFPSGHPISPTNQLHPSLAFVHPFVTSFAVSAVERVRWLGMTENRNQGPKLLRGGAESTRPLRRFEARNIIQMAHGDGTIRLWDAGHGDEIENSKTVQVDIARALNRIDDVSITKMSMSTYSGEFVVGTSKGEVVIYRWGGNKMYGKEDAPPLLATEKGGITMIPQRADPSLKEGLQPFALYDMSQRRITALKMSDVGFAGIGSEAGGLSIIDMRGPAVIFSASMCNFIKAEKRSSFMKKANTQTSSSDWPTTIEFGIMTLDGDGYSSIACFVGTNGGKLATFKILPQPTGGYTATFAGVTSLSDKVISINPISANSGKPVPATGVAMAALQNGQQTNGVVVVVTESEVRIFKPASTKGAHKTWDHFICESACISEFEDHGFALVGVFGDGTTRAFSLPALKELGVSRLDIFDKTRISNTIVTPAGDVLGWTGPSEIAMLSVWGTGQLLPKSQDKLCNPQALVPPRPTISNLQWIAGTQYCSPTDLDLLIGGPDRPPSKRMLAAAAEEDRAAQSSATAVASGSSREPEGWGDFMTRQLNERTEKLNIMGDSMDNLQDNSKGWSDDVNKMIRNQKKNLVMGAVTGKWF